MAGAQLRSLLGPGEVTAPAPRWRAATGLLLSLAGLGVSAYLTVDHFAKIPLACSDTGLVNCQKVTTSAQSHILGIPVAVLGLAFYLVMTVLNLPVAWGATDRRVHLVRLALSLAGIAFVLYLVAAELLIIGSICVWCTSVHVITFLLLVLVLTTVPAMVGWATPPAATAGSGRRPGKPAGRPGQPGRQGRSPTRPSPVGNGPSHGPRAATGRRDHR